MFFSALTLGAGLVLTGCGSLSATNSTADGPTAAQSTLTLDVSTPASPSAADATSAAATSAPPTSAAPASAAPAKQAVVQAPAAAPAPVKSVAKQTYSPAPPSPAPARSTAPAKPSLCGAPQNPFGYNFCGRGGYIYSPDGSVCDYFNCINNFDNGTGYMVECNDGMYSMSGGKRGACSYHGGESRPVYSG